MSVSVRVVRSVVMVGVVASAVFLISLCCGAQFFSPARVCRALFFVPDELIDKVIIVNVRLVRTCTAALCGGLLALSGALFQGLFRNPLADPFCIGASSGASLGAVCAIVFGAGAAGIPVAAFIGAGCAVVFVLLITQLCGAHAGKSPVIMILAGTGISSFVAAATSVISAVFPQHIQKIYLWSMGSFNGGTIDVLPVLTGALVLSVIAGLHEHRALDILGSGDAQAQTMGVNTVRTTIIVAVAASLAAAAAVAYCGIVGFVGLTAPHAVRPFCGSTHRRVIPAAVLSGAVFTVLADIVARTVIRPAEIPAGVVTALIGAPVFLLILIKTGKK